MQNSPNESCEHVLGGRLTVKLMMVNYEMETFSVLLW